MTTRAFVDSNVLASRTLHDWLFLIQRRVPNMFELHSSLDVLAEAVRVARVRQPDAPGSFTADLYALLEKNLNEVHRQFPASTDFTGADPGDRHVHAATLASGASYLITSNRRDFGDPDELPYEIYLPDEFFCLVDDGATEQVREVTREQNRYWQRKKSEGRTVKSLDVALRDAGCPAFADRVQKHLQVLAGPRPPSR